MLILDGPGGGQGLGEEVTRQLGRQHRQRPGPVILILNSQGGVQGLGEKVSCQSGRQRG